MKKSTLLDIEPIPDLILISKIKELIPIGSSILEISCGNAADALKLKEIGYKITCTDNDINYVNNAIDKGLNCIQHDTLNTFNFSTDKFDLVYSRLGLHYFDESQLDKIFKNISNVCNKYLIFSVKIVDDDKGTNKKIFTKDNWMSMTNKYFNVLNIDEKEGELYGSKSKWIEITAINKKLNMNEAVFRSPKWVRKFLDFELNTGNDIKGEPSEKRKKKDLLDKWDEIWKKTDEEQFINFYSDVFNADITEYDLYDIRDKWRGNFELFEKFDKWVDKLKKEEEVKNEVDNIYKAIVNDFQRSPYSDKIINHGIINGHNTLTYTFENKFIVTCIDNGKLVGCIIKYKDIKYTLNNIMRAKFVKLFNEIIDLIRSKKAWTRKNNKKTNTNQGSKQKSNNPKLDLYRSIKDTIARRKEELSKMSKSDPDRVNRENELKTAEKTLSDMKTKYGIKESVVIKFSDFC